MLVSRRARSRQDFAGIDPGAAGRPHVVGGAVHMLLGFLRFGLVKQSLAEMTLHLGQRALRFRQREITHMF